MQQKPEQFGTQYAEVFKHSQVVSDYRYRAPYPEETFTLLAGLLTDEPRAVLDVGSGSGDLARSMVGFADRVDAVDFSREMIALGKQLPHGDDPRLQWIYGKVEEAELHPPYALITAGSSIHWPNWSVAFPRFRSMLTPHGYLAIIYRDTLPMPWEQELRELRKQLSIEHNKHSANAVAELEARGFFQRSGYKETAPAPFQRTLEEYITSMHSHSRMARELIGEAQAAEFDAQVRKLLLRYHPDGVIPLQVVARVTWGKPEVGKAL
jgi:SAM-dependent methyltransferase